MNGITSQCALSSFRKNRFPDPAYVSQLFLLQLGTEARKTLLAVYNKIWVKECFPSYWSTTVVISLL